jgi:signal transduction histidine kinase
MTLVLDNAHECGQNANGECACSASLKEFKKTVSKISHEMSQPLMVIQGYLELLELGKVQADPKGMEQALNCVSVQVDKLTEIYGTLRKVV